jgi:TonB-linked SusC/RagA family outer membrane protein
MQTPTLTGTSLFSRLTRYEESPLLRRLIRAAAFATTLFFGLFGTALAVGTSSNGTHVTFGLDELERLAGDTYSPLNRKVLPAVEKTVRGKVSDPTGESLPGVNVTVKGEQKGTITNLAGEFTLETLSDNAVLVFSFVGYVTEEVLVGQQSFLNVSLQEDKKTLDELVVVGYGTQKKVNLTGSVATLDGKFLANRPITNASQALQGLPGVYVNMNQGRPGADGADITIRGANSYFTGSAPLVLVDGVEFSLRDVNPNDIDNISVLKDASSAAIYGSRAQNGVILVTTKSGKHNSKVKVDYNGYFGIQEINRKPENVVTNAVDYMEGKNRALFNEGRLPEYSQELIEEYRNGTDPYIYPNTNWFDVMFRRAPIQEHNLRVSGGGNKSSYAVSLGYLGQKGILPGSDASKYSFATNIKSDVTDWLSLGSNFIGTYWSYKEGAYTSNDENGEGGIMGLIYRGLPMQTALTADGKYADQWVRVPGHNFFRNPYALSLEGQHRNNSLRALANLYAEVNLPFDIKYKITAAPNIYFTNEKYNYPVIPLTNPKTGAVANMGNIPARGVRQGSDFDFSFTNFHTLTWNKDFNRNHSLGILAGHSIEAFNQSQYGARNQGYLGNEITELTGGTLNPVVSGTSSKARLMSYFGRVNYSFKDKYLLESNFRYDGSSRFEKSNRWAFFPSVSAGWRISEEDFLKQADAISNLKLRASWGKLGNQAIPLFSYINAVELGPNYPFNNVVSSGAAVKTLADPGLSWETTVSTNVGLDLGLFNNQFTLEFDVFQKLTEGILARVNLPEQVGGLNGPLRNIGSVSNKGFELTASYRGNLRKLNYNLGANVTSLKNKVTNTGGAIYYNGNRIIQEGYAINSFFGLVSDGIFQSANEIKDAPFQNNSTSPGDLRYKDANGDKVVDSGDRQVIGQSFPAYTYSFTAGGDYKDFDFSLFFQGIQGLDTYSTANLASPYRNGAGVTSEWLTESWTPENPNARLPRLTTANGYPQNYQFSDFWLQDISYLRLKNVQIGYNLPIGKLEKVGLSKARIYINGQNLLTFSPFKLGDPERNPAQQGIIAYPISRLYSAGLVLSF